MTLKCHNNYLNILSKINILLLQSKTYIDGIIIANFIND